MVDEEKKWTKWWWLGYFGAQNWSVEERNVRMALFATVFVVMMVGLFSVGAFLEWFGIDPHVAAPSAALLSVVPGFCFARPVAAVLYSDLLRRADENSKNRLSRSSLNPN